MQELLHHFSVGQKPLRVVGRQPRRWGMCASRKTSLMSRPQHPADLLGIGRDGQSESDDALRRHPATSGLEVTMRRLDQPADHLREADAGFGRQVLEVGLERRIDPQVQTRCVQTPPATQATPNGAAVSGGGALPSPGRRRRTGPIGGAPWRWRSRGTDIPAHERARPDGEAVTPRARIQARQPGYRVRGESAGAEISSSRPLSPVGSDCRAHPCASPGPRGGTGGRVALSTEKSSAGR